MLKIWEMWTTSSLPSLPGPLCSGVIATDRVLSMGQIELNWLIWNQLFLHLTVGLNWVLLLNWMVWNRIFLHLTVCIFFKKMYLYKTGWFELIKMTYFCVKLPKKSWYAEKPTNQPTNQHQFKPGALFIKWWSHIYPPNSITINWWPCARPSSVYTVKNVKLATVVKGDSKAPFSKATTPRCRGGRYFFPWITPLYPWYVPYNARRHQVPLFESLVWLDLGLTLNLPNYWQRLLIRPRVHSWQFLWLILIFFKTQHNELSYFQWNKTDIIRTDR